MLETRTGSGDEKLRGNCRGWRLLLGPLFRCHFARTTAYGLEPIGSEQLCWIVGLGKVSRVQSYEGDGLVARAEFTRKTFQLSYCSFHLRGQTPAGFCKRVGMLLRSAAQRRSYIRCKPLPVSDKKITALCHLLTPRLFCPRCLVLCSCELCRD